MINDYYEVLHDRAKDKLAYSIYNFISSTAGNGLSYHNNTAALQKIKIVPRVLNGVEKVNLGVSIFDHYYSNPFLIAPMAYQKLIHPQGELAVWASATKFNIPFLLSTLSTTDFPEFPLAENKPWFQLYLTNHQALNDNLIEQANRHCDAIVVTVDVAKYSSRPKEMVQPIVFNDNTMPNLIINAGLDIRNISHNLLAQHITKQLKSNLSWDDIAYIRQKSKLPIILKGILHPQDAKKAQLMGVDGLIVSNHGGRQINAAISSVSALGPIINEFNSENVFFDSGIRDGEDIFKVSALGAKAACIARPILWSLAVNGSDGINEYLSQLQAQLLELMTLTGQSDFMAIDSTLISTNIP